MVAISDPKRKSGISILGDAPWGTHFCQFYQTKQDLIEILVPYFKTGLENNEFCMWVTSEPLTVEEARAELQKAVKDLDQYNKKGQIEILDFSQWYTRTGKFDADKVVRGWVDKEQQARKNGFEGLRLTGNTFWIEHKDWKSFSDYEATINNVIHNYHMLAICPYSLDKCDANDILDVFSTHQFALINRNGKWAIIESTERKQVEEALRDSERQYRTLFESANDAILIFEPENEIILEANQKACETYGFAKKELVGMSLKKLTLDVARGEQQVAELLRTGTYGNFETVHLRADGTPIDFLASSSVIDYGGQRAILSVMRDVTERKQAQKAVQESEERLRTIVEASLDAIVAVNAEGRIVLFNDAAQDLFQYSKEDALKQPAKILLREEMGQIHQERLERFLNVGVGQCGHIGRRMDKVFRRKDGSLFEGEASMSGGRLDGLRLVVLAVHDITERKRTEETLRESQEMFQKAFQASPDTMVLHSLSEGRHMDVNESFLRLIGYRREELVGRTAMDLGLWWDLAQGNEYLRVLREQGRVRDLEICVRTKSGEARTLLLSAEVIEIAGQDCVVAIGKDISERKQAEQERMRLEEQLRQAQKIEAVGRLAGGVAHDFNNILMVINGYVQLVLRKLSPRHPLRQNLNEIRKAGERAASLTGQLLAFSRRQILVPRILDLNKVVADTKEMLRRVIGEDVELVIRQGHKLAKVLADPGQIAQVLVNLAVNARDAMPGGGRLTVETGNVDLREAETGDLPGAAPGPYVMLAVSDTGVGISKEVMEHMFEPFFTTREQGKGTGLGLSMVYGVVKQSGGYVLVQSEPGQGSAFRIYLPCAQVGSGKPAARSAKARLAKGRETILVVEDELAVRQVVAATLRSWVESVNFCK